MTNSIIFKLKKHVFNRLFEHRYIEKRHLHQSEQLMLLVREMIDLAYLYGSDTDKFYRKFIETINVKSLQQRGVIDPDVLLHTPKYNLMCSELKKEDAELWTLLKAGFTTRELMMVYGHTNINSVYVKVNRLRKRLDRKMQELMDDRLV